VLFTVLHVTVLLPVGVIKATDIILYYATQNVAHARYDKTRNPRIFCSSLASSRNTK